MSKRRQPPLGDAAPSVVTPTASIASPSSPYVPQPHEKPMTPRQLAEWLQISPATIRRRLNSLPHMKVGNRIRFMPGEVIQHFRKKL